MDFDTLLVQGPLGINDAIADVDIGRLVNLVSLTHSFTMDYLRLMLHYCASIKWINYAILTHSGVKGFFIISEHFQGSDYYRTKIHWCYQDPFIREGTFPTAGLIQMVRYIFRSWVSTIPWTHLLKADC